MDAQAADGLQREPADRIRGARIALKPQPAPPPASSSSPSAAAAEALAARLGHAFGERDLLAQALTHRSHGAVHNERLEFVGDAVLDCAVALILYQRFPHIPEGELSRVRAHLVNRDTLARLARGLDVGAALRFGEGEQKSGGAGRSSIVADALEAVIGAIFVDGGFDAARAAIDRVYAQELADLDPAALGKDPKTRLQEWLQARRIAVPAYAVIETAGEAHAQSFVVECRIAALDLVTRGAGGSRRAAEQEAASGAYAAIVAKGAAAAEAPRRG